MLEIHFIYDVQPICMCVGLILSHWWKVQTIRLLDAFYDLYNFMLEIWEILSTSEHQTDTRISIRILFIHKYISFATMPIMANVS